MKIFSRLVVAAIFTQATVTGQNQVARDLVVASTTKLLSSGDYQWSIYVDGSERTLQSISAVEYVLDSTLAPSLGAVKRTSNRAAHFVLSSQGHPELHVTTSFSVLVRILTNNGTSKFDRSVVPFRPFPGTDKWQIVQVLTTKEKEFSVLSREEKKNYRSRARTIEIGDFEVSGDDAVVPVVIRDEVIGLAKQPLETPEFPKVTAIKVSKRPVPGTHTSEWHVVD